MEDKIYMPDGTIMTYEEYLEYKENNWSGLEQRIRESNQVPLFFHFLWKKKGEKSGVSCARMKKSASSVIWRRRVFYIASCVNLPYNKAAQLLVA